MIPAQCDVVVIGSGPGGSMAAGMLAQNGHHVVLLDRQTQPRYAVGESIIPDFWKFSDILGATPRIEDEGFVRKAGGIVLWKGTKRAVAFKDYGYQRPALHVERDRFDYLLFERACELGVQAFQEVTVTTVNFADGEGAEVLYRREGETSSEKISCKHVVDASGQRSVIGSQLHLREVDHDFRFMSVWGYFKNSQYYAFDGSVQPADNVKRISPVTYIVSMAHANDQGWMWHIMQREEVSIGFVLPIDSIKGHKQDRRWEEYFLHLVELTPMLPEFLAEASFQEGSVRLVRDYSYRMARVNGPGFFLVGDAAGFIDPIYSNGVVLALYTGYMAAWCIDMIARRPETAERYHSLYDTQVNNRLDLARALALPNYTTGLRLTKGMRAVWEMATEDQKRLVSAAAALTGRAVNMGDPALNRRK